MGEFRETNSLESNSGQLKRNIDMLRNECTNIHTTCPFTRRAKNLDVNHLLFNGPEGLGEGLNWYRYDIDVVAEWHTAATTYFIRLGIPT